MTTKKFLKLKKTARFEDFLGWLKSQDPDRDYNYDDVFSCPIARYAQSLGFHGVEGNWISFFYDWDGEQAEAFVMPKRLLDEAVDVFQTAGTYGDLWAGLEEIYENL